MRTSVRNTQCAVSSSQTGQKVTVVWELDTAHWVFLTDVRIARRTGRAWVCAGGLLAGRMGEEGDASVTVLQSGFVIEMPLGWEEVPLW